jgi:hypothetical protein
VLLFLVDIDILHLLKDVFDEMNVCWNSLYLLYVLFCNMCHKLRMLVQFHVDLDNSKDVGECYQYKYTFGLNIASNNHSYNEANWIDHFLHSLTKSQQKFFRLFWKLSVRNSLLSKCYFFWWTKSVWQMSCWFAVDFLLKHWTII